MAKRKRLKNTPDARLMRRAVAYDRLAAKAHRNGESRQFEMYLDKSIRLREQAQRIRERRYQQEGR